MKRRYLASLLLLMAVLFGGCFQDLGNYDYVALDDLTIELPDKTYRLPLGAQLQINPIITTTIPEDDLEYRWEVIALDEVSQYNDFLVFATGKNLNFTTALSTLMPSLSTYSMRLHILQKSNGRQFYSETFSYSVVGQINGLMVLHGDEEKSDIGILRAAEFLATKDTATTAIYPHFYSSRNGKFIPGKGHSIVQFIASYMEWSPGGTGNADVVVITDKGGVLGSYSTIEEKGDWNSMFYGHLNKGKAESYELDGQTAFAVDSGELYIKTALQNFYVTPDMPASKGYYFGSSVMMTSNPIQMQGFFFDKKSRGFIGMRYVFNAGGGSSGIYALETTTPFNAANMNADLLFLDKGGAANHFLAAMKQDDGTKFVVELHPNQSKQSLFSWAKYDMSSLPEVADANYFAWGENMINMCYYASPTNVYRFTASNGAPLVAEKLMTTSGVEISFGNEVVTMMKILKPNKSERPSYSYYNYNKILLISTYAGTPGSGKVYSCTINQLTGRVASCNVYSGFDQIRDANIKGI